MLRRFTIALTAVWLLLALLTGVKVVVVLVVLVGILARDYVWRKLFGGRWFGPAFSGVFGEESFGRRKRQIAAERRRAARQ